MMEMILLTIEASKSQRGSNRLNRNIKPVFNHTKAIKNKKPSMNTMTTHMENKSINLHWVSKIAANTKALSTNKRSSTL